MKKILTLFLLLGSLAGAKAVTVLSWNPLDQTIVGSTINPLAANSTVDPNLATGGGLNTLTGVGILSGSITNGFGGNSWNTTDTFEPTSDYISFSVQAGSGFELTLSSISFAVNGSNSGPATGRWGYSIGGGSFVLQDTFTITGTATSLSWDFTDFVTTQSVEFRFWAYGATSINGTTSLAAGTVRLADTGNRLSLDGSLAAVPEPSTCVLLGLGLAMGLKVAGRRKRIG